KPLEPPTSRPITTRVVRHGHDGAASRSREQRAAQSITFRLPGRHASAFGEDHDPEPIPKAPLTLIDDLLDRAIAAPAVDRNWLQQTQHPAEHGHPHQLAL